MGRERREPSGGKWGEVVVDCRSAWERRGELWGGTDEMDGVARLERVFADWILVLEHSPGVDQSLMLYRDRRISSGDDSLQFEHGSRRRNGDGEFEIGGPLDRDLEVREDGGFAGHGRN